MGLLVVFVVFIAIIQMPGTTKHSSDYGLYRHFSVPSKLFINLVIQWGKLQRTNAQTNSFYQ